MCCDRCPAGLGEVLQCRARLGLLGAFRVETELAQVLVEVLHGLGRIFRRRLDRDFDEFLAVGQPPFLERQFVREALRRELPAQHANRAKDVQRTKIDAAFVELAEESLLVLRKELLDRPLALRDVSYLVTFLKHRERCRADHPVADTILL